MPKAKAKTNQKKSPSGAPTGSVMVVGGGIAGIQASLDLAKSGFFVHLVENKPAIGGVMAQLDKTFPTNDCSMCIISPKLVECGRHLNIQIHTLTNVAAISGDEGNFTITLEKTPRYVDPAKCTGCGSCTEVCPVAITDEFNAGLAEGKAVYRLYPQAIPSTFAIKKADRAPCVLACPANLSAQGYVQLIKEKKFPEALSVIMDRLPLPGTIGRICPHPCETDCRRQEVDEPIAICDLKRFVADTADWSNLPVPEVPKRSEKVAIIGAGPSGLSCAYHLALQGYQAVIFEAAPEAGGWLRYGIPAYRLPRAVLQQEVDYIQRCGVQINYNTPIGGDRTIKKLLTRDGFNAVFIGVGAQDSIRLPVPGSDAQGVLWGVEYLKDSAMGQGPDLAGKKVVVIGGGNVAMDVARTARRQEAGVTLISLESREEMPASPWEVNEAEHEGIVIVNRWGVKEINAAGGQVTGLTLKAVARVFDADGRFSPTYFEDNTTTRDAEVVIMAIGQKTNLKFITAADGIALTPRGLIETDPATKATSVAGVFAGGDVETGPWIAIAAVAAGREAAISIDRFLSGQDLKEGRQFPLKPIPQEQGHWNPIPEKTQKRPRSAMPTEPVAEWIKSFNEINLGLSEAEAVVEADRCLNCGICSECMQCVAACQAGAIAHGQKLETEEVKVGSVILASGFKPFDPSKYASYNYAKLPNVVTSLEFERILSASGPFAGHLVRPSDHSEPKKIAWLQCVGSRDVKYHSYCSGVCCMYAIKEAVIAKEHAPNGLDTAIFFMDLRTHGKQFEQYGNRARDEYGVRFIRSRIHTIDPAANDNLRITYVTETGEKLAEEFDMVVLSVGMEVPEESQKLAQTLNIDLTQHNFAKTDTFAPVTASRPGVFVCGTMQGPKDIPESVMEASAAAAASSVALSESRGTETRTREKPPEREISPEDLPKVGVFVCNCGINIGGIVDVPGLREYARTLPHVVHVEDNLFTCSQDTQVNIAKVINEHQLNRIVVAACTPITHEPMFRETMIDVGLNKYLFEMANIRNQDSWVHMQEKDKATEKAKDLVRMAVARVSLLKPLKEEPLTINQRAVVVGGGVAGLNAALNLADQGFETIIIEKEKDLGGNARNLHHTIEGADVQAYLDRLIKQVRSRDKIQILTEALVVGFKGYKGNFTTEVLVGPGMYERKIDHGVTIIATGASEYKPTEHLYGQHDRVMTQLELGRLLHVREETAARWQRAVFIQCVGSRNEQNPNCSRICCQGAVKNALELKDLNPEMEVIILYRDMRTYGMLEDYYLEARNRGVLFSRFDLERQPEVLNEDGRLSINFIDHVLGLPVKLPVDAVILSAATLANENEELASLLKIPRTPDGFFIEAHAKLRPVDFSSEGLFLCGTAHAPKLISESISQSLAAASRAGAFLADTNQTISGVTAIVDPTRCAACLVCVMTCPYNVPEITAENVSWINQAMCQGCGTCASECPAKVIQLSHFEDEQIMANIKTAFEEG
jgi:heterodisulfide reductase subunit A-like polyferredoxin